MKIYFTALVFWCVFAILACSDMDASKSSITATQPNPNGDSELALLMREMFEDGLRMKQQIEEGEQLEILKKFETIHTAQATEPKKAVSPAYKAYADVYLQQIEKLKVSSKENTKDMFQALVTSCMNCHQAMCPGPMVRIKKLYIEHDK